MTQIGFVLEATEVVHQTPTKRSKQLPNTQPKTAESNQKLSSSFDDIDAETLFRDFDKYCSVTQHQEPQQHYLDQSVTKKLNYQTHLPTAKLIFSPTTSSMKKKVSPVYQQENQKPFEEIVLFEVTSEDPRPAAGRGGVVQAGKVETTRYETPKSRGVRSKAGECWATSKKNFGQ